MCLSLLGIVVYKIELSIAVNFKLRVCFEIKCVRADTTNVKRRPPPPRSQSDGAAYPLLRRLGADPNIVGRFAEAALKKIALRSRKN